MLFSVMMKVMDEISKDQLEIIERPFQGVNPKITNGLFKSYRNLWSFGDGVYVLSEKQTVSVLNVLNGESKEFLEVSHF